MEKILVTGALGQIGSELINRLRYEYGAEKVVGSDIRHEESEVTQTGPFEVLDVTNGQQMYEIAKQYQVDTVIHLAALLSSTAETKPQLAWNLNMGGLINGLEVARQLNCQFFAPSSIAAFGPGTPLQNTPQDTIQRPNTMYGITKVSGELLSDYYFHKFGVDTRSVRFPGLISHVALPGGGTTDYAVEIYYEAIKRGRYTSYIAAGTYMDMMYMPDALDAIIMLMEADVSRLKHRNAFNITAMSVEPEDIARSIANEIPEFTLTYEVDPVRQSIADSWPNSLDITCAVEEWGFHPNYDLNMMTKDMISHLRKKLRVNSSAN